MLNPFKKKKKVLIGIHGLGNKPPRRLLKRWWKLALLEGLERIGHPGLRFEFEMAYWASYLNSQPLNAYVHDPNHPLYIQHPYVPAKSTPSSKPATRKWRKRYLDVLEKVMDALFLSEHWWFNFDSISDRIIRKKFQSLDLYYRADQPLNRRGLHVQQIIRRKLAKVLRRFREHEIMLIAHSMGSIVAYDVLTQEVPDIEIHTFVTLGSPLGLPAIIKRILQEQGVDVKHEKRPPTPENIRKAWYNFADLRDTVALNYNLADDYRPNSRGVGPVDVIVNNDYEYAGEKYPHASYGYLRAPELAQVVYDFLTERKFAPLAAVRNLLQRFKKSPEKVRFSRADR